MGRSNGHFIHADLEKKRIGVLFFFFFFFFFLNFYFNKFTGWRVGKEKAAVVILTEYHQVYLQKHSVARKIVALMINTATSSFLGLRWVTLIKFS